MMVCILKEMHPQANRPTDQPSGIFPEAKKSKKNRAPQVRHGVNALQVDMVMNVASMEFYFFNVFI